MEPKGINGEAGQDEKKSYTTGKEERERVRKTEPAGREAPVKKTRQIWLL